MDAKHILTIGTAFKPVRGGIAAVENVYSTFYKPFNHIATVGAGDDSKIRKAIIFFRAYLKFWWWMLFHKEIKIVHVHASSGPSFWRKRIFINIAKRCGKKVVFHCHGGKFPEFTAKHFDAISETINKCDCIVALSEWWRQWFEETFHCKNVVVIKNVIAQPHIEKIKHSKYTFLFLGLLGENKGIYDLLDVVTLHKNEFEGKIKLLIGGNGETDKVKTIIHEKHLEDIVKFEGWVSGEKKERLLNSADAFILPSYHEGVPISILEAESYGLPIVSTQVGGIPEIVKENKNGILVTPGDKKGIYKAIVWIMTDTTKTKEMGSESLKIAEEHLPQHVESQISEMYNLLLTAL